MALWSKKSPRLVLAGTNSGCGKTTVTCAVLQALVSRGLRVGAAKCGPDYIDPMFHSRVIGREKLQLRQLRLSATPCAICWRTTAQAATLR